MSRPMGWGYHGVTRPDGMMGRGKLRDKITSAQNKITKRRAAKKRRQRDRTVEE